MILITGASGRVARRTAELAARNGLALRLMTRSPEKAPVLPGAEVVKGGFADLPSLDAALAGISVVLVVSGSAKPGERALLHAQAFQAAVRARVRHVIYLSLQGASSVSNYPFNRDHFLSEQYLAASGLPHTVLRNSFYLDMFPDKFDDEGVIRGPAKKGRAAFVSREDCARTAAAILEALPGGIHEVTGPEALSVADVARRLSTLAGRDLRYEDKELEISQSREGTLAWRADLEQGWFKAIAARELEKTSDTVFRFTGSRPLTLEQYFTAFPALLRPLHPVRSLPSKA